MAPPKVMGPVVEVRLTVCAEASVASVTFVVSSALASITVMSPSAPTPPLVSDKLLAAVFTAVPIPMPPALAVKLNAFAVAVPAPPTTPLTPPWTWTLSSTVPSVHVPSQGVICMVAVTSYSPITRPTRRRCGPSTPMLSMRRTHRRVCS